MVKLKYVEEVIELAVGVPHTVIFSVWKKRPPEREGQRETWEGTEGKRRVRGHSGPRRTMQQTQAGAETQRGGEGQEAGVGEETSQGWGEEEVEGVCEF